MAKRSVNLLLAALAVLLVGSVIWYMVRQSPPDRPLVPERKGWGDPVTVTAVTDIVVRDEQGRETSVIAEVSGMATLNALQLPGDLVGQIEPAEESELQTYPLKIFYADGDGRTFCVAVSPEGAGCYGEGISARQMAGGTVWRMMSRGMGEYLE